MAVVKKKPTSPGRRFVVQVVNHDLHKGAPYGPLLRGGLNEEITLPKNSVTSLFGNSLITFSYELH